MNARKGTLVGVGMVPRGEVGLIVAIIGVKAGIFSKEIFWLAGVLIGLMVGPNQSCSRSLMAQLTPKEKQNEFFGFFALTGKATSFLGPLLFGIITSYYSQQMALWVVIILFIIGLIIYFIYTGKVGFLISFLRSILPNLLKIIGI